VGITPRAFVDVRASIAWRAYGLVGICSSAIVVSAVIVPKQTRSGRAAL
jgi:hypothetical protein